MKSGLGRVLAGVCVAAALAGTAACGAESGDDAGKSSDKAAQKPAAKAKPGLPALTEAQLTKAALAKGDVKGYRITKAAEDEIPDVSVPADPASCQAIADLFFLGTEPDAKARVARSVISVTRTEATIVRVGLFGNEEGDAKKLVADLREQSESCDAYEHTDYKYSDVTPGKASDLGDESVAFTLAGVVDKEKMQLGYTIVRSGSTVLVFQALNAMNGEKAEVPAEVVEAQVAKLEKQA
ncbi:hypothetical protein V2W30_15885 [Streptomyces sp. Q6]|uniref:Uncharacterized protein n=1 Tax=Streptomyces citrinus TaxID=3118173 RepID=A0ACD5ABU7_9ACTN